MVLFILSIGWRLLEYKVSNPALAPPLPVATQSQTWPCWVRCILGTTYFMVCVAMFSCCKQWCYQLVLNHNIIRCMFRCAAVPHRVLYTWGCGSTGADAGHRPLPTQEPVTCRLWVDSTESWWRGALTYRICHHWRTPRTQVRDHMDGYEGVFLHVFFFFLIYWQIDSFELTIKMWFIWE